MTPEPYKVRVEPDVLPARALSGILLAGVLIVVASAILVNLLLPSDNPAPSEIQGAPERIGQLEQSLILATHEAAARSAAKKAGIERFGWVDQQQGLVRIPIDRAMQLVVEGQR